MGAILSTNFFTEICRSYKMYMLRKLNDGKVISGSIVIEFSQITLEIIDICIGSCVKLIIL